MSRTPAPRRRATLASLAAELKVSRTTISNAYNRPDQLSADLRDRIFAAAAALVSSLTGAVLPAETVYFGELGLSGAIRPVIHTGLRLRETSKLGFRKAVVPPSPPAKDGPEAEGGSGFAASECAHVAALVAEIAALGGRERLPRDADDE